MASSVQMSTATPIPSVDDAKSGLRALYHTEERRDQRWAPDARPVHEKDEIMRDQPVARPEITYMPSRPGYEQRGQRLSKARSEKGEGVVSLPPGFPARVDGPRLWSGLEGVDVSKWIVYLSDEDIYEAETALKHFKDLPGDNGPDQMCKALFPLPTLGTKLEELTAGIHAGQGIVFLRGFDPNKYDELDNVLLYTGVASYFGEQRGCQDGLGNMIVHLVDFKSVFGDDSIRPDSYRANEMPFHTDVGDILCMYVLDIAPEGGESTFASSAAVYNEIAATRPDVINVLAADDWYYDVSGGPIGDIWPHRALLFNEPTHGPFFIISRRKLTGADDFILSHNLPAMTEEQAEAIDHVHFVAKKHSIAFKAQPGDMMFCNNLNLLHARNEYAQTAADSHKRHLLRLWLRNEDLAWQTPPGLENDWFKVYGESARRADAFWAIKAQEINKERLLNHKLSCWN